MKLKSKSTCAVVDKFLICTSLKIKVSEPPTGFTLHLPTLECLLKDVGVHNDLVTNTLKGYVNE